MTPPWFGLFLPQLRMTFPTILERTGFPAGEPTVTSVPGLRPG